MAATGPGVLSMGSLSKSVWGGLRIGWIRAESEVIHRLAVIRAQGDMSGAVFEQLMAVRLIDQLDAIVAGRRSALRRQRDVLLDALRLRLPTWRVGTPAGGLSAWVDLGLAAATPLTHQLERRGVLINPGSRFAVDASQERYLRIPFALAETDLIRAVDLLAQSWVEMQAGPVLTRRPSSLVTA
jgi:DNA-binding transcriptional MocR family regulator